MENSKGFSNWVLLISKLIWPTFIAILLIMFSKQTSEVYDVVLNSIKSGRSVEIGSLLKLGEAANRTEIGDLSYEDMSIKMIRGPAGVVRKGSSSHLVKLVQELEKNPLKTIDTLLLPGDGTYSIKLLRDYIGTLGLRFVVFQRGNKFDGWISSSTFMAQLQEEDAGENTVSYDFLRNNIRGISQQTVSPDESGKEVLKKMQELHVDSIPVVDSDGRWLFFASRGEILAHLITEIILEKHD